MDIFLLVFGSSIFLISFINGFENNSELQVSSVGIGKTQLAEIIINQEEDENNEKPIVNDIALLSKQISRSLHGVLKTSKDLLTRNAVQNIVKKNRKDAQRHHHISIALFNQLKSKELSRNGFPVPRHHASNKIQGKRKNKFSKNRSLKKVIKRKLRRLKANGKLVRFQYSDLMQWLKLRKKTEN